MPYIAATHIAGQRSDPLGALLHVVARNRPVVLLNAGETPPRLAAEVGDEVHNVAAEYPQVFPTAAAVFFSASS